jgi:hypothetical protein
MGSITAMVLQEFINGLNPKILEGKEGLRC